MNYDLLQPTGLVLRLCLALHLETHDSMRVQWHGFSVRPALSGANFGQLPVPADRQAEPANPVVRVRVEAATTTDRGDASRQVAPQLAGAP